MQLPGLYTFNRFLAFRFIPMILFALVINIIVFFAIQLMVTGEYRGLGGTTFQDIDNFIRVSRDLTPPQATQDNVEQIQPEIEDELPPPELPSPQFAPPAPVSPVSTPITSPDIEISTNPTANLNRLLGAARPRPSAPRIATNLVPSVRIPPVYPQRALRDGIEGIVTVEFTIARDGSVKDPKIIRSIPEGVFDQAVLQVIGRWKYTPEMVNGQPVEIRARQDVDFSFTE